MNINNYNKIKEKIIKEKTRKNNKIIEIFQITLSNAIKLGLIIRLYN